MPPGTIHINAKYSFMQPAFRNRVVLISIDGGEPQSTKWGDTSHAVDPGEHTVHVEVLYALNQRVGKASTAVSVAADEAVSLKYRPPALVFMQGKLKRQG